MDKDLKNCPFCNGKAKITNMRVETTGANTNYGVIDNITYRAEAKCDCCDCSIEREWSVYERPDKKIIVVGETILEAWNRRATNG